jgi:glutamate:Na+ symporter, ESS family
MTSIEIPGLLTFTIAILVFFLGSRLNQIVSPLRKWNIPEAVTGGLAASVVLLIVQDAFGLALSFSLDSRDMLLLYFFTSVGLNVRFADLVSGGRLLVTLLVLTVVFLVIQNAIAVGSAALLGLPRGLAPFLGSAALIGGHGTIIAWAPIISERFSLPNALEIGTAVATLGLVVASLVGGPTARFLIARHELRGSSGDDLVVGLPETPGGREEDDVSHVSFLRTLLVLNAAILIGYVLDELVADIGIKLPLFVLCLLTAIVLSNTVPRLVPHIAWPTRTRALALVSDLSLSIFLSMSLMSMQLTTLAELGPALMAVLTVQTVAAVAYTVLVIFPGMGRNYEAAVFCSGFSGISLGATPTAIANMTAVTKMHGVAPRAFIILPLVSASFIDIANAVAIGYLAH